MGLEPKNCLEVENNLHFFEWYLAKKKKNVQYPGCLKVVAGS